jgi:outer membrane receptor protein involved in Fe transport
MTVTDGRAGHFRTVSAVVRVRPGAVRQAVGHRPGDRGRAHGDNPRLDPIHREVSSWIDGNRDFSIPRLTAPGYTVVNLAANYTINPYTTVFARIDNLLNEQYQNPIGDRPGFGIFGGGPGGEPIAQRMASGGARNCRITS